MRRTVLVLAVAAGCIPPSVSVTPSERPVALAPRPSGCEIEFLRAGRPERPYDEVAVVNVKAYRDDRAGTQEALRRAACTLGADAVLVTQEYVDLYMSGTALSYRELREKHRADAAARWAAIAPAVERDLEALRQQARTAGAEGPPAGFVPGRVREVARPRSTPDRRSTELGELRSGTPLWMAPRASAGWRRIWTPAAPICWMEDAFVEALPSGPEAPPRVEGGR